MSDAPTPAPPVAPPAAPVTGPVKILMKVPMKVVMKVPMKVPMPGTGTAFKLPVPVPKPAAPAVPKASAPAVKAMPAKPAVTKPQAKPIKMDDEDDLLLSSAKAAPRKVIPRAASKRSRSSSSSSSGSSASGSSSGGSDTEESESGDEDEKLTLFSFAKNKDMLVTEFADEDLEAPMDLGGPAQPPRQRVTSNIDADIEKILATIAKTETTLQLKEDSKTVSLGTSKTNYIDPRIVFAFAKRTNMDPKRLLPSTLMDKFKWAQNADPDFAF